ncbi:MAG: ABC transporter permease [Candidatus Eremiobacteraeota bacterium]|nr:ABC transporter permease [Candidatus Eremiobacteraeota bacterium]
MLAGSALAMAALVALPLGVLVAHRARLRGPLLSALGIGRVVPSLAVLTLMIPLFGVGWRPAIVALALLAIPPIAINTDLGFRSVPEAALDAARGMGMTAMQIRNRVEVPLALPVIFAGLRTASIEVIASATLAAFIGGGGLGEYITSGLQNNDDGLLLLGGISVAALALLVEIALALIQRRMGEV